MDDISKEAIRNAKALLDALERGEDEDRYWISMSSGILYVDKMPDKNELYNQCLSTKEALYRLLGYI